jgi:hypothetical protein
VLALSVAICGLTNGVASAAVPPPLLVSAQLQGQTMTLRLSRAVRGNEKVILTLREYKLLHFQRYITDVSPPGFPDGDESPRSATVKTSTSQAVFRFDLNPHPLQRFVVTVRWSQGRKTKSTSTVVDSRWARPVTARPVGPSEAEFDAAKETGPSQVTAIEFVNPCIGVAIEYDPRNQTYDGARAALDSAVSALQPITGRRIIVVGPGEAPTDLMRVDMRWDYEGRRFEGLQPTGFANSSYTYMPKFGSLLQSDAIVRLSPDLPRDGLPDGYLALLLHELGHIFGLPDDPPSETIMGYNNGFEQEVGVDGSTTVLRILSAKNVVYSSNEEASLRSLNQQRACSPGNFALLGQP